MLTIRNGAAAEADNRDAAIERPREVPVRGHDLGKAGVDEANFAIDEHAGNAFYEIVRTVVEREGWSSTALPTGSLARGPSANAATTRAVSCPPNARVSLA
jgi:hypothetical protein